MRGRVADAKIGCGALEGAAEVVEVVGVVEVLGADGVAVCGGVVCDVVGGVEEEGMVGGVWWGWWLKKERVDGIVVGACEGGGGLGVAEEVEVGVVVWGCGGRQQGLDEGGEAMEELGAVLVVGGGGGVADVEGGGDLGAEGEGAVAADLEAAAELGDAVEPDVGDGEVECVADGACGGVVLVGEGVCGNGPWVGAMEEVVTVGASGVGVWFFFLGVLDAAVGLLLQRVEHFQ